MHDRIISLKGEVWSHNTISNHLISLAFFFVIEGTTIYFWLVKCVVLWDFALKNWLISHCHLFCIIYICSLLIVLSFLLRFMDSDWLLHWYLKTLLTLCNVYHTCHISIADVILLMQNVGFSLSVVIKIDK